MIKTTHNDKMVYTEPCSHSLLCTLFHSHAPSLHSHSLPSTLTHFYLFLTHSYSFPAFFHPLPLMFSSLLLILNPPPTVCRLSHPFPVHIQILTPNRIHHLPLQPKFSPFIYVRTCFTYLCVCALCFTFPCTYVIHFYALCYVYILSMPLRVLISQDYLYTLRFFKIYL